MSRKRMASQLVLLVLLGALAGCGDIDSSSDAATSSVSFVSASTATPTEATDAVDTEPVTLTVAGAWTECRALDEVGRDFTAEYANCTIVYEYLQDYTTSIVKRLSGENQVDLFFTTNIFVDSELIPYVINLNQREDLDLSHTFEGLLENFSFQEEGVTGKSMYSIPLGGEMRGLYVNTTLLDSLNLAIPTDQESLLAACEVLKENGYIAFHGNPGIFSQTLLYPWVCNLIANADDPQAAYNQVELREPGLGELFREPYAFLYTLVENDYYDYKTAQTDLNLFVDSTDEVYAMHFLNIQQNGDVWEKADGVGQIAFMPAPMSLQNTIEKTKDDYHSDIEYEFIPAPVSDEGGFVYLSPAHGIAANKNSPNADWSIKFLNFLFQPEHNETFAEAFNVIPNTTEAMDYITSLYNLPDDRVSELGQVTFSYSFYDTVVESLTDVSKANNPKYMQVNADGTTSMYALEYYLNLFEESVKAQ